MHSEHNCCFSLADEFTLFNVETSPPYYRGIFYSRKSYKSFKVSLLFASILTSSLYSPVYASIGRVPHDQILNYVHAYQLSFPLILYLHFVFLTVFHFLPEDGSCVRFFLLYDGFLMLFLRLEFWFFSDFTRFYFKNVK